MARFGIVVCLVAALLLTGCEGLPHSVTELKHSLNPEPWWDDHPFVRGATTAALVTGAVVGVVALLWVAGAAQDHTDRGH
jgi:hypothetical protein